MGRAMTGVVLLLGLMLPVVVSGCTEQPPAVVAVVNDREITYQEWEVYMNMRRIADSERVFDEDEKKAILDEMITDLLLYYEAVERGFEPDSALVDRDYQQYRNVIKDHLLEKSEVRYQLHLQELSLSEEMVLEWVERFNTAQQLMRDVGARVLPPTAEEVEAFYERHKEQFRIGERRHLRQILITEESLGDEYEDVEAMAQDIYQRLGQGEDFAALAAKYSADSYSKGHGGDLGWFEYDDMFPELAEVVFEMDAGIVSQPIETEHGLHLVEVLDIKAPDYRPVEEVFESISEHLYKNEQEQRTTEFINRIRRRADIDIRW